MTDEPTPPEPTMIMLHFRVEGGDWSEGMMATPTGPNRWRLEESSIGSPRARFGNVVEVEPLPSGDLRLVRVVRRSPYRRHGWTLSRHAVESSEFAAFERRVKAAGGIVTVALGGVVVIDLPKGSGLDVEAEIDAVLETLGPPPPLTLRRAKPRPWYRRLWRRLAG
jgi:hypothetical protein